MNIGIRDLRNGLSQYLDIVRLGRSLTVTDRGRPVARIVPVDSLTTLEKLTDEGRVTPGHRTARPRLDPVEVSATVSDLVGDQRR